MNKLIFFKLNIRLIIALSIFVNTIIASGWIYQADLLNAETINGQNIKELSGNVFISKDETTLTTKKAILYSDNDQLELFGDIIMISNADTLKCDTLFYYPNNDLDYFIAAGNVILLNNDNQINSDSLYYWSKIDSIYASGNVIINDSSTNLYAKSINYWKTNGFYGYSFTANDNVSIINPDSEIKGQEIIYVDSIQHMSILDDASVVRKNQKLIGDTMLIQFQDSNINKINIEDRPIVYNNVQAKLFIDSTFYDYQDIMYGESMELEYQDNNLKYMKIIGMANSLYHVINDTLLNGYNDVSGDTITLSFLNDELKNMYVQGGARGTFYPEMKNSSLDTSIYYMASEIDYIIDEEKNYFYDNASINYQDIELSANYIQVDWNTNKLQSYILNEIQPIVKTGSNSNPMIGDTLFYNLISKKGIIKKGIMEVNNGYYHGNEILNDNLENIYTHNGMYTSCDLNDPHFYFFSKKMKIIKDKNIIAKPIVLHISEFPIMWFPFAILPNQGGNRKSGWIMPSFGYSERNGTYFHNLGYYFVINDFSDIRFLTNFYDRKGFKFNTKFRYKKRYKYNGHISSILVRDLSSSTDNIYNIFSNQTVQSWNLKWNHSHIIDPSQSFFIKFNYVSRNDFYQQDQVGYDVNTRLNQQLSSSMNYRKNWKNSNNTLTLNASDSYDLLAEDREFTENDINKTFFHRTLTLPSITFNHGSRLLFGDGAKWFNSIYYSLNSNMKVRIRRGHIAYNDIASIIDTTSYQNGVNHTFTITAAQKIFKWINITPRIKLVESWIYGYKERIKDSTGSFIKNDNNQYQYNHFNDSFKRRMTGDVSIGFNTKLYGIISTKILSLSAIRHVITPSVTYSYRPDFSQNSIFGIDINYVDIDSNDNKYDYFSSSLVSSTPSGERRSYNFSLRNDFHGKFYFNDIAQKVHLLSWSSSASYDATKDSLNWSYISSSLRTNILNRLNIDLSLKHDLYKMKNENRVNQFSQNPRLVNIDSGVQFSLEGKKISGFESNNIRMKEYDATNNSNDIYESNSTDSLDYYEPIISDENLWEANFSFRGSMHPSSNLDEEWNKNFWFHSNFDFNLTKNWAIAYSVRFDLLDNEVTSHSMYIYRQLHCWLFSFRWYPGVGPNHFGNGFQLLIRVKNPDLQDIRFRETDGKMFGS